MGADRSGANREQRHAGTGGLALNAPERNATLARNLILARYLALVMVGVAAVVLGGDRDTRIVAGTLVLIGLPYNAVFDVLLRRTGKLTPVMAFSDQVFAVGLLAAVPELLGPGLLFLTTINATNAVAFGRRAAIEAAGTGMLGAVAIAYLESVPDPEALLVTFCVLNLFLAWTVGAMSDAERDVRGRYHELMGGIDAIVWEQLTRNPSTLYVNEEAVQVLGYPADAWREPGTWGRIVHPDDRHEVRRRYREAIRRGENAELEYRMVAADGRVVHVLDRMRVESDDLGQPVRVRGVMLDVSTRREAQQAARRFADLVDAIRLALFVFARPEGEDGGPLVVVAANPEAARLVGSSPETAVGRTLEDLLPRVADDVGERFLDDVIRSGEAVSLDEIRPSGSHRGGPVFSAHAFPLPGDAVGLSLTDITERTMAAEVLRRQALHDGLTGLPNRLLLTERLRSAIQSADGDRRVALIMLDLDQFKEVNDALGHDHGDRLLIELSRRLQRVLRDADTIARLGGDEFAVLLTGYDDPDGAEETAIAIHLALEQPFQLGGISVQTAASIGIAVFPDHAPDPETLAQRADIATYAAKRSGERTKVYAPELDRSSVRRLALLGELRQAIADGHLVLHYQPTLDLTTGEVRSNEALVRWQHEEHGLLPPVEFIELAELSGLIQPMTRWIIDSALGQARAWLDAGIEMRVGVNLSVRNLYEPDLVPWLDDRLLAHGVPAGLLKLEITESELMDDPLLAMEVLGKLRALGAATSIDDFGTGYSSLSYLKHLPIDELKIDRSFVDKMTTDASDLTIVRSTIDLAHNLGLSVVAEGVEDADTLRALAALGCDRAQGYYLSKPVPADVLDAWLAGNERLDEARQLLGTT